MANWRRERDTSVVHVVPDAAPALCDLDGEHLGPTIWTAADAAPHICHTCAQRLGAATDEAEAAFAAALRDRGVSVLEVAKTAARRLVRMVPSGVHADLLVYARACLVRGDPRDAHPSIQRWRVSMRAMGIRVDWSDPMPQKFALVRVETRPSMGHQRGCFRPCDFDHHINRRSPSFCQQRLWEVPVGESIPRASS